MTFNIPKDLALVSTTVTDSTPAHSATTLYLEEDEVQYSGGVYIMPLEKNNDVPTFDSVEPYSRGDYVVYSGVASALERDVSQAINVPLTASANYSSPTFEQLIEPNNMQYVSTLPHIAFSYTYTNAIDGDVLYVVSNNNDSLTAVDVSDRSNPTIISVFKSASITSARNLAIYQGVCYVICSGGTVDIVAIDITNPSSMVELGNFSTANISVAGGIAIYGGVAYVTSYSINNITALDISDPTTISELGTLNSATLSQAGDIKIKDSVAYVVSYNSNAITSVDISVPATMSVLNSYTNASLAGAAGLDISGSVAYVVAVTSDTITSIDISNPSSLSALDTFTNANMDSTSGISIDGETAYITASNTRKLVAIDISTPSSLSESSSIDIPISVSPYGVSIGEGYAYISDLSANSITIVKIPVSSSGDDIGLYNFYTTKYSTHIDITVTRISDSVVMATGEFYYEDSASHISRYYGTGCTTGCGANRLVWIGDDKVYVFTASYTHTNGAIAADFRDTYLAPYGFTYVRPTRPSLPFDTKQYTSVIETGNQTWVVKSLTAFDGVALGQVRGDTISITFKDSLGVTVGTPVVDQTINNIIDTSLPDAYTTEIFYAGSVIEANGTVEITIKGTETEIGKIFPTASYIVGSTNLQFSHEIVDFSKEQVSAISGAVDRIEGNKVIDYKGSYDIEMVDYDKAVMLQKYMTGRLVAIDGSDMINNEVADGQGRFASTKIICRIRRLSMKSTVKDDDIAVTTPISFEFREIV